VAHRHRRRHSALLPREPHPRLVARLVGGELRGRARGRRSLEEARRDVGEDPEERAPSRVSRRDRRSPPTVPELGEIDHTLTGGGRVIEGRTNGYSPFAPTNRLPGASTSPPRRLIARPTYGRHVAGAGGAQFGFFHGELGSRNSLT
jgi:hypothetical protein